jgi:hypothetical protein
LAVSSGRREENCMLQEYAIRHVVIIQFKMGISDVTRITKYRNVKIPNYYKWKSGNPEKSKIPE